jgi:hypothetical protein
MAAGGQATVLGSDCLAVGAMGAVRGCGTKAQTASTPPALAALAAIRADQTGDSR